MELIHILVELLQNFDIRLEERAGRGNPIDLLLKFDLNGESIFLVLELHRLYHLLLFFVPTILYGSLRFDLLFFLLHLKGELGLSSCFTILGC